MDGGCLERRLSKDRGIFGSITRTGFGKSCLLLNVARLHADIQLVVNSMTLIAAMKKKISHPVESLYGFNTSRAPESISKNAELAQGLLTDMTFIYRVRPIAIVVDSILSYVHVTGIQDRWDASTRISTPDHSKGYQSDVVPEQGRRWDCLL